MYGVDENFHVFRINMGMDAMPKVEYVPGTITETLEDIAGFHTYTRG